MTKRSFVTFVDENIALLSRLYDEGFVTKLKGLGDGRVFKPKHRKSKAYVLKTRRFGSQNTTWHENEIAASFLFPLSV